MLSMSDRARVGRMGLVVAFVVSLGQTALGQEAKIQRLGGGRYMTETVQEMSAGKLKTLRVNSSGSMGGSISVSTRSGADIRLEMLKVFKVNSEAEAATFEREIGFDVQSREDVLELDVRTDRDTPWEGSEHSARVELNITLPRGWDFEFSGKFFEFDLKGPFRAVDVQTEYGRIQLADVTEALRLFGNYTAVEARNIRGDIQAQTTFADLILRDAIPSAERPARLTNQHGTIVVDKFAGAIIAETENAPIFVEDAVILGSGSTLRAANAMIRATLSEFSNASLDVRNSNSVVVLKVPKTLSTRLNCSVGTGGSITTSGLVIQTHPDLMAIGRLEGICGDGKGVIDIDVTGPGQIGIEGK